MINRRRVVETYDPGADRRGTGFLLSSSLVLTAAHCVPSGRGATVAVRSEQETDFLDDVTVRWAGAGDCDIAVLELANSHRYGHVGASQVSFGRPVGVVNWQAVGFPWAQERPGHVRPRTAAESAAGRLDPLTGMRAGTYDVEITSGTPQDRGQGLSPWSGMSGAAVFAEDALVAVLVEDPDRFGPGRLRAVPITCLLEDPEAAALVAPDGTPEVEAVWPGHRELLARPYEPLPSPPTPLLLLQYQYAALPFHAARADDLAALQTWCDDDAAVAVAVVEGVGGTGKTRLAAELCRIVRSQGWVAGLLVDPADPDRVRTFARLAEPRLVVVDAAETRVNDVLALAKVLASHAQDAPVRILLLVRSMGPGGTEVAGWWRGLQTARNPLQATFLAAEHRTLTPLLTGQAGVGARRAIFQAARQRFAQLLQVPDSATEPRNLAEPTYDTFLFLQIAALVALTAPDQLSASEADLLTAVLDTERVLIWRPTAREHLQSEATDVELDAALAVATLAVADRRDSAVALLEKVPDVVAAGPVTRIADWLHGLYPGGGWLRPIRPDRLGEHHAGQVIRDHPNLPKLLLDYAAARLDAQEGDARTEAARLAGRTLTVLARAAARDDDQGREVRRRLEATLEEPGPNGEPLLGQFVDLVIRYQSNVTATAPLVTALTATIAVTQMPAAVAAARERLDRQLGKSYVLDDLGSAIDLQRLRHARELAATDPARRLELFEALLGGRVALMHSGRNTDSAAMAREALALARQLHHEDPGRHAVTLARGLEVATVSGVDPRQAAEYARDALAIRRQLSADDPQQLRALASNYQSLAYRLSDLGRYEEALQAVEHQIATLEALAEANRSPSYMHDSIRQEISRARIWSAHHLAKAGRVKEAIGYVRAYVAKEQRASPVREEVLAGAYGLLADVLREVGQAAEAIEPANRQVEIYRTLESRSPGRYLESLTSGLMMLGNVLREAERSQDAVDVNREIISLHRRMAEVSPDRRRPVLAMMLGNYGYSLIAAGLSNEAVDAFQEAVSIWEQLSAQGAGDRQQLALAYGNYCNALAAVGRHEEALDAAHKSVDIWEELASQGISVRQHLANGYLTKANALRDLGRPAEAIESASRAIGLLRTLEEERPDQFSGQLAGALNILALSLHDAGRSQDEVEAAREVVALYRRMAEANPAHHRSSLAMMLGNLGNALVAAGNGDEAVHAAKEAVGILDRLATPGKQGRQQLAFAYGNLTNALAAVGRHDEAIAVARKTLAIWELVEGESRGDTSNLQSARQRLQDLLDK